MCSPASHIALFGFPVVKGYGNTTLENTHYHNPCIERSLGSLPQTSGLALYAGALHALYSSLENGRFPIGLLQISGKDNIHAFH